MLAAPSPISLQFATPAQLLLLRAALLEGPAAVEAAEEWFASVGEAAEPGFPWLEQGSRRLLPLVYRNLKESLPSELRQTLRRVVLQYWADNQKLFRRLEERLTWFQANGIPTLVLKGAALSVLHYRDKGIRPMSDVDILVPEDVAGDVIDRLQRDGWSAADYCSEAPRNSYFYRHIHAIALAHPQHGEFDLHWHVLHAATFPGADSAFWADSVPLSLNTIATRALNPTDQLLHVCVHSFNPTGVAPIRWIADALTILRTSQMDWSRLVRSAEHLRGEHTFGRYFELPPGYISVPRSPATCPGNSPPSARTLRNGAISQDSRSLTGPVRKYLRKTGNGIGVPIETCPPSSAWPRCPANFSCIIICPA